MKIDRSFMVDEPHAKRIMRGVMGLAQSLGLTTLAEGVEEKKQLDYLKLLGCELVQGFYFARPEPPEKAGSRLTVLEGA